MPIDPTISLEAVRPFAFDKCAAFRLLEEKKNVELVFEAYPWVRAWLTNNLPLSEWPQDGVHLRFDEPAPNEFVNGKRDGAWAEYYDAVKPRKKEEGNYSDGFKDGVWHEYHYCGGLRRAVIYINGVLTGLEHYYYPNGKMAAEWTNEAGTIEGAFKSWFSNGNTAIEATFSEDNATSYQRYNRRGKPVGPPLVLPTGKELRIFYHEQTNLR